METIGVGLFCCGILIVFGVCCYIFICYVIDCECLILNFFMMPCNKFTM